MTRQAALFPDWAKWDEKGLARYVNADAIRFLGKLPENSFDLPEDPDGRRRVLELIYNQLLESGISLDLVGFGYDDKFQKIRTPTDILDGAGRGSSLDLSLLFAGLAEGYDLIPVVVVMEGHAFVVVSVKNGRNDWDSFGRSEQRALSEPVKDIEVLRRLVDSGDYVAIECTGFAASEKLRDNPDAAHPETLGRDERGLMSFEQALTAGHAQLFDRPEPLGFALDITMAHRHMEPYELRDSALIVSEREPYVAVTLADHGEPVTLDSEDGEASVALPRPVMPRLRPMKGFVDRRVELQQIRKAVGSGSLVSIVGEAGVGKTSLLRRLAYDNTVIEDLPDGAVYVRAHRTQAEDVLQEIYDGFYPAGEPQKPSESSIKLRLRDTQALIMLDDVDLAEDEVEDLTYSLPLSSFVIAGRAENLQSDEFVRIELRGLGLDDALELLEMRLGESIPEEEREAAREICGAVDGHPGRLVEAADAVLAGQSLAEVAGR